MKIEKLFQELKANNKKGLVPFVSCGDVSIEFTKKLIKQISQNGADIIEVGVPFSDPMADGKTIQASSTRALKNGVNILKIIQMLKELKDEGVKTPFVLFSYYNPIYKIGIQKVAQLSKEAGISAWLVVDVPLEESHEIKYTLKENDIDIIMLATPTTPLDRVENLSEVGSGFLYYVSVAGVTGQRNTLPEGLEERMCDIRKSSKLPVAIGFGISSPEMAAQASKFADAIVIGSKFVDMIYSDFEKSGEECAIKKACEFIKEVKAQMNKE